MLLIRVTEGRQGFEPGAPVTSVSRNKWEGRQKGGIARVVVGIDARNEEKITIAGVCVRVCTTHVLPVEPHVVISAIPRLLLHLSFLFGRMSDLPAEEKCNVRITAYIQSSDISLLAGREDCRVDRRKKMLRRPVIFRDSRDDVYVDISYRVSRAKNTLFLRDICTW